MPAKYLYMGISWDASNHLLPTTRLVKWLLDSTRTLRRSEGADNSEYPASETDGRSPNLQSLARTVYHAVRNRLSFMNLLAEEWYRQIVTYTHVRRGVIVIFDRHFFFDYDSDYKAGLTRPLRRRIHGFLLSRVYPKPDLVIYLDAPPEMLFERKGERTVEWLEKRKSDYLSHGRAFEHFVVLDSNQMLADVTNEVVAAIRTFAQSRTSGEALTTPGRGDT